MKDKSKKELDNEIALENHVKGTKTINEAIKTWKYIVLIMITVFPIVMLLLFISYIKLRNAKDEKVYVITETNTYEAYKRVDENRADSEIKNHMYFFYRTMYAHDQYSYEENINRALMLIEKEDGSKIVKDYTDAGLIDMYKKYDSRTMIEIDSVVIDKNVDPWNIYTYGAQKAIYKDEVQILPIASICNMRQTQRSDDNPFGLVIYNYKNIKYDRPEKETIF